jgi:hypothetical protein
MALTVAPAPGFDSLVSLEAANADCTAMGLAGWTGNDLVKEAALRRATQYLTAHYRIKAEYLDPVHKKVGDACCEAAVRSLTGTLYTDVAPAAVTGKTVGPISVTYAAPTNNGQTRFSIIDDLLRGLTFSAFGQIGLVRA